MGCLIPRSQGFVSGGWQQEVRKGVKFSKRAFGGGIGDSFQGRGGGVSVGGVGQICWAARYERWIWRREGAGGCLWGVGAAKLEVWGGVNESVTVVAAKSETVTVALHRAKNGRYAHGGGAEVIWGAWGVRKKRWWVSREEASGLP